MTVDGEPRRRPAELELLRGVESRVHGTGVPALVVISGEPGTGKSRLVREWRSGEPDTRTLWATVRASQSASSVLSELVGRHNGNGTAIRDHLRSIALLAASGRTALVVEDAHHADDELLTALIRVTDGPRPLLVVLTARPPLTAHRFGVAAPARNALHLTLDRPAAAQRPSAPTETDHDLQFASALELWPDTMNGELS